MEPILVFLPGLGDDHRLFKYQTAAFPNSVAADWIDSLPNEILEDYAVRFAETIRNEIDAKLKPSPETPILVCGLSLGGMIAPYVARCLNASEYVLLCSLRNPEQFPRTYYFDWLLMRFCPPLRPLRVFCTQIFAWTLVRCCPCVVQLFVSPSVVNTLAETPTLRLAGLARMMFDWAYRKRSSDEIDVKKPEIPSLQVHGTNDWLLPIKLTNPDVRIQGGGHLLAITHPEEINAILQKRVDELSK